MVNPSPRNPTKKHILTMVCFRVFFVSVFLLLALQRYLAQDHASAIAIILVSVILSAVYIIWPLVKVRRGDYAESRESTD
jgi:FtsH-binding integral membrane protein